MHRQSQVEYVIEMNSIDKLEDDVNFEISSVKGKNTLCEPSFLDNFFFWRKLYHSK